MLYGSETGAAEDIAGELGNTAERLHFQTTVDEMDNFKLVRYPSKILHYLFRYKRRPNRTIATNRQISSAHRWSSLSHQLLGKVTCQKTHSSSGKTSGERNSTTPTASGRCGSPYSGSGIVHIQSTRPRLLRDKSIRYRL